MLNPMVQSDLVTYMGGTIVILFLQAANKHADSNRKMLSFNTIFPFRVGMLFLARPNTGNILNIILFSYY